MKLGKARVLAKSRPGIDVQSIVFTDEKFFRLEQDDRQQRVWLDSVHDEERCALVHFGQ